MTSRVFIESQGFAADSLCSCLPKANFCDIDSRTRTCKDTRNVLNRYSKYMQIHADTVTDTSAQGKSSLVPNSTRPWRCETGETAQITKLKLHPFLPSAINRRHFRHQTPKCCRLSGFVSKGFTHGRPTRFFRGEC